MDHSGHTITELRELRIWAADQQNRHRDTGARTLPRYDWPKHAENAAAGRARGLPFCRADLVDALRAIVEGRVSERPGGSGTELLVDCRPVDTATDVALTDLLCASLARANADTPARWEPTPLGVQVDALWAVRARRHGLDPAPGRTTPR